MVLNSELKKKKESLHSVIGDLQFQIELRQKEDIVKFVITRVPTDEELKKFLETRRIPKKIIEKWDERDGKCIYIKDERWHYNPENDIMKLGTEAWKIHFNKFR